MQTLAPYAELQDIADVLKNEDLILQMKDGLHLLSIMHADQEDAWADHPVLRMWKGHEIFLAYYTLAMIEEGLHNRATLRQSSSFIGELTEWKASAEQHLAWASSGDATMKAPSWWGVIGYMREHRAVLLRRDPVWYRKHFATEKMDRFETWPEA